MLDEANAWGHHNYEKATYIEEISDEAIAVVLDHLPRKNSPMSILLFYMLDEAYSEVGEDDTAFGGGRSPRFGMFIVAACPTAELLPAERAWVRSFWDAMLLYTAGIGSYVNAMADADDDRVQATYGAAKYQRLANIKGKFDPQNLFHRNVNIKPA